MSIWDERIRQVGVNEEPMTRATGFTLFTSKQEAKVTKGSYRKFWVIVARKTLHFQGSLCKHKNTEGMYRKSYSTILAPQWCFLRPRFMFHHHSAKLATRTVENFIKIKKIYN